MLPATVHQSTVCGVNMASRNTGECKTAARAQSQEHQELEEPRAWRGRIPLPWDYVSPDFYWFAMALPLLANDVFFKF